MIIITDLKMITDVILHAHSLSMDISEITIDEVLQTLDDEQLNGDHQGRLYCWPNNHPEEVLDQEIIGVLEYKDLCTEEYEFDSLEQGDVVFFFYEAHPEEGPKIAWHMATFDNIER